MTGHNYFECMGAKIAWRKRDEAGSSAPTILYLRGEEHLPGDQAFEDALAARHTLIIPDHPGFGASDNPDWFRAMGDMAYFYLDFLAALDLGAIHIAGASIGGWIGAEIAVRDSARIASLSLMAPLGVRQRGVSFRDVFLATPEENMRALFADPALAERFVQREQTKDDTAALLKDRYATARIGWAPRFHNPELQRWLHRITPPVQLLWGEEDTIAPPAMAQAWLAGLPDARLVTIPQCGHLPHMEAPDKTASAIISFIQEARS
ncbi:MAG: alpha/beta fold hydrolase [Beijerinckiaceae bacterium]|jgi:pimeloyl-ACP methyl ester carboxylesterase|nr:alpha/beta fold hydrolase [Beijerinckiaceae bacterium]